MRSQSNHQCASVVAGLNPANLLPDDREEALQRYQTKLENLQGPPATLETGRQSVVIILTVETIVCCGGNRVGRVLLPLEKNGRQTENGTIKCPRSYTCLNSSCPASKNLVSWGYSAQYPTSST